MSAAQKRPRSRATASPAAEAPAAPQPPRRGGKRATGTPPPPAGPSTPAAPPSATVPDTSAAPSAAEASPQATRRRGRRSTRTAPTETAPAPPAAPSTDGAGATLVEARSAPTDGARPPWGTAPGAVEAEIPPSLLTRLRLPTLLGRGALTVTYRATDLERRRPVALKLFPAALGADPDYRQRFLDKARTAQALEHPHIVRVFDAGLADGRPYLVTELVEGQSLRALLALRGRLPLHTALQLTVQIADALIYAHERGVFHADLRPENVLLDRQGRAKVVDFGLCHVAVATGVVALDTLEHRAAYLAPEQIRGDSIGPRTDLYALAAILYEMLVGTPPVAGPQALASAGRRLFAAPPRLRAERPDVSWGLEYVVRQALAPDASDRPPSVQAFRDALLAPPRDGDLTVGLTQAAWAFRSALSGAPRADWQPAAEPIGRVPRRRTTFGWPGSSLAMALPLLATLALVIVLLGVFDVLPPLLMPLQAVAAPDLRGRMYAEAELVARDSGLEAIKTRPEPCDDHPRDYVLAQEPAAGTVVRRGSKVRLTTCSGLRVPNLIGQREEQARLHLLQHGWWVREVRTAPRGDVPAGTIVGQEPAAGLILPDKQPLVLTIAQPPPE